MAKGRKLHSELCSAILHASPAAMFLYDIDSLRILAANDKALARYGYTGQEFHSMTVRNLRPQNGPALCSALLIDQDAPSRSLWTHVTKTGEPFAVELSVVPFCRGRRRMAILSAVDATNWREARLNAGVQDGVRAQEFEEQRASADSEMEAVGRFAGGVAHDFNNITQSIGLSCELALRGALPLPVRTKLFGIMQQANRAADITQRLLAFSRRQILQPRVVNLNECIEEALPALRSSLGLNISMDLRLDERLPPAYIDPEQLTHVLAHLADNARVAMPDGGVLRIASAWDAKDDAKDEVENPVPGKPFAALPAPDESERSAQESSRRLLLTVSDTGVGMDEATRRRIFEPFFSTKKTAQTAGLGLATVHGIIHQSNGRIECASAPGRGTTFRIWIPVATNKKAEAPAAAAPSAAAAAEHRLRILLVDEAPPAGSPILEALHSAGFSVSIAADGWEALASFTRQSYDLVVSGIAIAGLGGVELAHRLRQLAPEVPVVLISGQAPGSVLEDLPHNQIAYLQKPFSGSLLLAIVRNLLPAPEPD
jgi:two-component system, cell cycle sensor histidine kinase and response regulator CckA